MKDKEGAGYIVVQTLPSTFKRLKIVSDLYGSGSNVVLDILGTFQIQENEEDNVK
jgi:hypothetical protein